MISLPRVAILHPELRGGAGSEAAALWLAQAIEDFAHVTLVSMGPVDLPRLDGIYGTNLTPAKIETVSIPIPRLFAHRFDALRGYRLGRWAKRNASGFDLVVSSYNVMDFGRQGIQIVADFSFDDALRRSLHPSPGRIKRVLYGKSPLRNIYLWLGRALSRESRAGWRGNRTFANSRWTRDVFEGRFNTACGVLYPPVVAAAGPAPWRERENGFVVLARMAPEKQVERTVAILDKVRKAGHDVHLHILGREDDRRTTERIKKLCRERPNWARYEGFVTGAKKDEFLARHRYGLSGCRHEAFGIGVAELARAGAIVWVPKGGGQMEIVGHEDLIYGDEWDAARKITRVLENGERQAALARHLEERSVLFSSERFVEEARKIVREFLRGGTGA